MKMRGNCAPSEGGSGSGLVGGAELKKLTGGAAGDEAPYPSVSVVSGEPCRSVWPENLNMST